MDIRYAQTILRGLGYALEIDGVDGPKTRTAVQMFQRQRGLTADGIVGPKTEAALIATGRNEAASSMRFLAAPTKRAINEIIIHCTATPEGRDVSVDAIRGWHKAQGWKDIGYHFVVMLDGTVLSGRPENQIGSHVAGHNTGTLGVVYVGGVARDDATAKDTRTPAQTTALMELCRALLARYPSVKKITGHNQYANKACPSFDVRKDPLGHLI